MKRSTAIALQAVIAAIGFAVLVFLLWEPQIEGRNAHATPFEIYFHDPFLVCAYIASIPFFVALYQAFKLVGGAGRDGIFSQRAVRALRMIRLCAFILIACVAAGEACLAFGVGGSDDIAGGVAMGVLVALLATAIATAAALFERTLQQRSLA